MAPEVWVYLQGAGIVAAVALLWRLNVLVSRQNGALVRVIADLTEHKLNVREDLARVHVRLDLLQAPRRS